MPLEAAVREGATANVLILDDDPHILALVSYALSNGPLKTLPAATVSRAREILGRIKPSLIILDCNLPDGDGMEFCTEIRMNPALSGVPILFLSARDSTRDKVLGFTLGGDDFLSKPFDVAELSARVIALLRRMSA